MDAYLAQIEKTPGTRVLVTFGRTPPWATADDKPSAYGVPGMSSPPRDIQDWRRYVRAMVQRYAGRIHEYEIWNEANTEPFWTGTTAQLVDLACAAAQEVRAVDPKAKIVAPNGTGAYPSRTRFVLDFLKAGGAACVDVVSYHLYTSGSAPESFVQPMLDLRADLKKAGFERFPLWNTESGYLTPGTGANAFGDWSQYEKDSRLGDRDASDYVIRSMVLARAIGFERFYTYAWDNDKLGQVDLVSGLPRESANAITRFYRSMAGNGLIANCDRSDTGIWACKVKVAAGSKNGIIVWVDPNAAAQIQYYTLPFTSVVTDFHIDAAPRIKKGTDVPISASPQLLVWD